MTVLLFPFFVGKLPFTLCATPTFILGALQSTTFHFFTLCVSHRTSYIFSHSLLAARKYTYHPMMTLRRRVHGPSVSGLVKISASVPTFLSCDALYTHDLLPFGNDETWYCFLLSKDISCAYMPSLRHWHSLQMICITLVVKLHETWIMPDWFPWWIRSLVWFREELGRARYNRAL
jgi:hypothetical protein